MSLSQAMPEDPLSAEWVRVASALGRIAAVTDMVRPVPRHCDGSTS